MSVLRLRSDNLFWREADGEVVALDAQSSRYFAANPTASALWERLVEGATRDELVDALCGRYRVAREVAEADVTAFLDELTARGLLES